MVNNFNNYVFHLRDKLVLPNGSGDTSYNWVQLVMNVILGILGAIIWTLIDFKKLNYEKTYYYLKTFLRYYVAMVAFQYGIMKLFGLQMNFPILSQLATPLGDFLPMRLSWLFIGYSEPYQIFSGILEMIVGLLLINGKTAKLGAMLGVGVFINVMMLNLCYDIPVKIFSIHMVLYCSVLLLQDYKNIVNFFVFNKATLVQKYYTPNFLKRVPKFTRIAGKLLFIGLIIIFPLYENYQHRQKMFVGDKSMAIPKGIYEVKTFVLQKDTIPVINTDSLIWKDIIFDNESMGSVNSCDTLLLKRYRRGYFFYKSDTIQKKLNCYKRSNEGDSIFLFTMKYKIKDSKIITFKTKIKGDSIYIEAEKSNRKFKLAEKQFHWLSDYNR
jgi:uncharacterized membrane protein YphA (DoxX/SURF4 family)